jgi:hypothetical protein
MVIDHLSFCFIGISLLTFFINTGYEYSLILQVVMYIFSSLQKNLFIPLFYCNAKVLELNKLYFIVGKIGVSLVFSF